MEKTKTTKKAEPKKKVVKKATKKKPASKGRNAKGKFVAGNKAAEKWTVATVLEKLQAMWAVLVKSDDDDDENDGPVNVVRANDIKTLAEVCLMHDVCPDTWAYWADKFKDDDSVLRLIKKIEWVLEARLIYSAQTMDIFILKTKYNYAEQLRIDHTTKGKEMPKQPTEIKFIPASALTQDQINQYLNQGNDWDSNADIRATN